LSGQRHRHLCPNNYAITNPNSHNFSYTYNFTNSDAFSYSDCIDSITDTDCDATSIANFTFLGNP
jgi:hypothetical protein